MFGTMDTVAADSHPQSNTVNVVNKELLNPGNSNEKSSSQLFKTNFNISRYNLSWKKYMKELDKKKQLFFSKNVNIKNILNQCCDVTNGDDAKTKQMLDQMSSQPVIQLDDNIMQNFKENDEMQKENIDNTSVFKIPRKKNKKKKKDKEKEKKKKEKKKKNKKEKEKDKEEEKKKKKKKKEKEKEKKMEIEKEMEMEKEKVTKKRKEKEKEKDTEKRKEKDTEKRKEKEKEKDTEKRKEKEKEKDTEKRKEKEKDTEKWKEKEKEKETMEMEKQSKNGDEILPVLLLDQDSNSIIDNSNIKLSDPNDIDSSKIVASYSSLNISQETNDKISISNKNKSSIEPCSDINLGTISDDGSLNHEFQQETINHNKIDANNSNKNLFDQQIESEIQTNDDFLNQASQQKKNNYCKSDENPFYQLLVYYLKSEIKINESLEIFSNFNTNSMNQQSLNDKLYTQHEVFETFRNILNFFLEVLDFDVTRNIVKLIKQENVFCNIDQLWGTPIIYELQILLINLLKLLDKIKYKYLVFMGCLITLFRSSIDASILSSNDLCVKFLEFTNIIKKCMLLVNEHFWDKWIPQGWSIYFYTGCIIIDEILIGSTQICVSTLIPDIYKIAPVPKTNESSNDISNIISNTESNTPTLQELQTNEVLVSTKRKHDISVATTSNTTTLSMLQTDSIPEKKKKKK